MKKSILLLIVGALLASSCIVAVAKTNVLGKWIYDTSADTYQYEYSKKYKRFCEERDSLVVFDEEVHGYDDVFYGYWKFTSNRCVYYYKYMNGSSDSTETYYHLYDDVLQLGATMWDILSLDKKQLVVQLKDTTYFYDDYYERQLAWVKTRTYVFNKED